MRRLIPLLLPLLSIAACAKDEPRAAPEPAPAADASADGAAPHVSLFVPKARALRAGADGGPDAAPAASAPPAMSSAQRAPLVPARAAGAPVKPAVTRKAAFEPEQQLEGWPAFEAFGLPAIAADGSRALVIEERDGWGHTETPGLRVLDVTGASPRSVAWFPFVPKGKAPTDWRAVEKDIDALVKRANDELTKGSWQALGPGPDDATESWSVDGLAIDATRATVADAGAEPRLARIVVKDAGGKPLADVDARPWNARTARCATIDLRLVGVARARGLVLFRQQLGATTHACDGVAVPIDYRLVRFTP